MRETNIPAAKGTHRKKTLAILAAATAAALPLAAIPATTAAARPLDNKPAGHRPGDDYHQTNLISNRTDQNAQVIDSDLRNSWGLALGPTTPLWAADNASGVATVYNVAPGGLSASKANLTVTIPGMRQSTMDGPSPTGEVFNPTDDFIVKSDKGSGPARFIFSSEAGKITAWSPDADPIVNGKSSAQLEFSSRTAVYKGLAIGSCEGKTFLYAANFHDGTIDVFNDKFHKVHLEGSFRDRRIPEGFAPFGIRVINGLLYVTYALQKEGGHDDQAGPGNGFVDVFTLDGLRVRRLASHGTLNSPWGLALAPDNFGRFSRKLLVGNFGDGRINAYDLRCACFVGQLKAENERPISIDGLWALTFGTAATGGTHTLLFSAGINDENDGLVGSINPANN